MASYPKYCDTCERFFHASQRGTTTCSRCSNKKRSQAASKNQKYKKKLIQERGHRCQTCGDTEARLFLHHIVSVKNGGANEPHNLKLVCHQCHKTIEHKGVWRG